MAVTVLGPLDKPVVTPTVQAGGSLAATTTYYVRVMAVGGGPYPVDLRTVSRSRISDEVSFTTTDVNKQCSLAFTEPAGAERYWVYVSTTSGSYSSKCQQPYNYSPITGSPWVLSSISNQTHGYNNGCIIWNRAASQIPDGITKDAGRLLVSFTGTTTLQDIYDQIVADGYGGNVYYDGQTFTLLGSIYCTGSTAGTLTQYDRSLTFLEGSLGCANSNITMTFGLYDSTDRKGDRGCTFYMPNSLNQFYSISAGTVNFYGCKIKGRYGLFGLEAYLGVNSATPTVRFSGAVVSDFAVFVQQQAMSDIVINGVSLEPYATQTRVEVRDARMVPTGNVTLTECIVRNGTTSPGGYGGSDLQLVGNITGNDLLFPNRSDNLPECWCSSGKYINLNSTFDLTVQALDQTAISGATVTIEDVNGDAITGSPFTTDADGNINTYILGYKRGRTAAGWGQHDYTTAFTPHTVTIVATGYSTRVIKYTMSEKRTEIEKLTADGTNIIDSTIYDSTIY